MDAEPALTCACRKTLYASKLLASTVRNHLCDPPPNGKFAGRRYVKNRRRKRPKDLRIYECPEGAGWHLATQEPPHREVL